MEEVKFGIVGVGGIGSAHGRAMLATPRARIVALCDIVPSQMEKFANKEMDEKVPFYEDFTDLCKDPTVDAIFVGTPNQVHVPVAREAVRQGKHVLSTKPLSDSAEAAAILVEEADASDVVNMMSLTMRFSDQVKYMKKLVQAGEFGELYYARARSVRRSGIPDWNLGFVEEGGGAFRDMGVHVLDSAWWLLGMPQPVSVTGVGGAKFGPRGEGYWNFRQPPEDYYKAFAADDYAGGIIRFDNGTGLIVESFWASHQDPEVQLELFGTEAGAKFKPLTLFRTVNGAPQDITVDIPERPNQMGHNILGHFMDCILEGVPCIAPLRHGLIVQEMMEAMLKSAETGEEIKMG
jgi:predicted dehydrogenase